MSVADAMGIDLLVIVGVLAAFAVLALQVTILARLGAMLEAFVYGGGYSGLDAAMRLLDFGFIIAFFALAWGRLRGVEAPGLPAVAGSLALGLAFLFLTLELNTFLTRFVPALRAGGLSVLWALFALGLLVGGIRRRSAPLRYAGLALFVVVGFKVFLVDLASLDRFYRIFAFILLGLVALAGSFLYLRSRQDFARLPKPVEEEVAP